jgi:leucyl-tRNA---protein transferase
MQNKNVVLLNGKNLDSYLASGMYRLGCIVFTTGVIEEDAVLYNVHWLRYVVNQFSPTALHKKLLQQSQAFTVTIEKLFIDDEVELLYTKYKQSLAFSIAPSLKENLFDYANYDSQLFIFETYAIKIYDGNTLIGLGVFDNGTDSMAGIINCYHPQYKKYSLGKLLMLHKMLYAQQQNKLFYYPGYVIEQNHKFDYKFFLGKSICQLWNADEYCWYHANLHPAFNHIH